jgi:phosphoserine phosphatase
MGAGDEALSETNSRGDVFLLNISGRDRPGLVGKLASVLAQHDVNILDIGQAVIHDYLALGILVEIPTGSDWSSVMKELLFLAHDLEVQVRFNPVSLEHYEGWVGEQGKSRHIITVMGRKLTAGQFAAVATTCAAFGLNIDVITRLSGRVSLAKPEEFPRACVQLSVSGALEDESAMRRQLMDIAQRLEVDVAFHADDIYRRNRRLVVFDMDSTLIQVEVIDELAKIAGVGEQVSQITAAAMRGELDFRQSLTERVALLRGLEERMLAEVAAQLPLMEGAERVTQTLKRLGYKIGIISGGFDYFGRHLQQNLGFDYLFANRLEIENGRLTGRVVGDIIDGPRKAALLREIAALEKISLEQTIAVGDGANDIPMLSMAGMGIAFHAKPIVREKAGRAISNLGLDGLLFLIGIREREIHQDRALPALTSENGSN